MINSKSKAPHVEITALGQFVAEAVSKKSDTYTARSHTLTYDQSKDVATLSGDGRTDARLWRNNSLQPSEARTIRFSPKEGGRASIEGGSSIHIQ
jgi:hypothetical protein